MPVMSDKTLEEYATEWMALRLKLAMSQREFAQALGVCDKTVWSIEHARSLPSYRARKSFPKLKAKANLNAHFG